MLLDLLPHFEVLLVYWNNFNMHFNFISLDYDYDAFQRSGISPSLLFFEWLEVLLALSFSESIYLKTSLI